MTAPDHDSKFASRVAEFCLRDYSAPSATLRGGFETSPIWRALTEAGTEPWLDTGDVEAASSLWTQEFTSLTTNNTLLNKEVQKGIYDELIPSAAALLREADGAIDDSHLVLEIAFILNAVHGLQLVQKFDADVSVELHTDLAHDADASYRYGKRFAAIEPGRFIVKVPLTPAGLVAARRLSEDGIRLNFTLGFSARQNFAIATLARPTWVNVFMGRLNAFVSDNGFGDGKNVGERATLSSQQMLRMHPGDTKQIGASIRNGQQVLDLAGIDVMTIPTGAAEGFLELNPTNVANMTAGELPEVNFSEGVRASQFDSFWDVPESYQRAVEATALLDVASGSGSEIVESLRENGIKDLFPELSTSDRARLREESKIPKAASWQDRVDAGDAAWDALLTEAALESFSDDQRKLDERIRRFL